MKKTILLLIVATIFISGCSGTSTDSTSPKISTEKELVGKVDEEAAELGFPDRFISKNEESVDWSEASSERVSGMNVKVYDTGVTLEVCGGVNCDM